MSEVRRCLECGGLIMLIHWPPHVISLGTAWVHVTRFGRIKRRVKHRPVV